MKLECGCDDGHHCYCDRPKPDEAPCSIALNKACDLVADLSGSCPYEMELIDDQEYGCENKCGQDISICFKDYFLQDI